jgi:hypothetical protein
VLAIEVYLRMVLVGLRRTRNFRLHGQTASRHNFIRAWQTLVIVFVSGIVNISLSSIESVVCPKSARSH